MFLSWLASFFLISSTSSFRLRLSVNISRIFVKIRIIWMLTLIACWLLKTLESIATPCSVNTIGKYRAPPQLEVYKFNQSIGYRNLRHQFVAKGGISPDSFAGCPGGFWYLLAELTYLCPAKYCTCRGRFSRLWLKLISLLVSCVRFPLEQSLNH